MVLLLMTQERKKLLEECKKKFMKAIIVCNKLEV